MRPNRRSLVDPAERDAINETRRRFMEALSRGLSQAEAEAYSRGESVAIPAERKPEPRAPQTPNTVEPREQQRAVDLTGWEDLPYIPREAGGPNLKALASQVSNSPIRNKKEAEAAIQAELALREKEDAEARAGIVIPAGWEALAAGEMIALAASLTTEEVKTESDAERIIQIELARRAS